MNFERRLRKLNDLLASELGEPIYAWKWSEDLKHPMRAINDDGSLKFNYRCVCGLNASVHSAACRMTIAEPVWIVRKMRLDLERQWVLCRAIPSLPEDKFREVFGSMVEYRPFEWAPCDGANGAVSLEPSEEPSEAITWEVIRHIRALRSKSQAQMDSEYLDAVARREAQKRDNILQDIKSEAPAFNGIPGEKHHWSVGGLKDAAPVPIETVS